MRYISHLDLQRTLSRAVRRAAIPVAYTQGFNPQQRLVFAAPLAVGIEGRNEYFDLYLTEPWEKKRLIKTLSPELPAGLEIKAVSIVNPFDKPLPALVEAALYTAVFPAFPQEGGQIMQKIMEAKTVFAVRTGKNESKEVDVRPFIYALEMGQSPGGPCLFMLLATGSKGGARPEDVLAFFPEEKESVRLFRESVYIRKGETLLTPDGEPITKQGFSFAAPGPQSRI